MQRAHWVGKPACLINLYAPIVLKNTVTAIFLIARNRNDLKFREPVPQNKIKQISLIVYSSYRQNPQSREPRPRPHHLVFRQR